MLSDAQIERYSRQILLHEVGGHGQARLLGARVAVAGADRAAALAATLLGRAGIGALDAAPGIVASADLSPDCRLGTWREGSAPAADVIVDLANDPEHTVLPGLRGETARRPLVVGRRRGARAVLVLLVGRPCVACLPATALEPAPDPAVERPGGEPPGGEPPAGEPPAGEPLVAPAALALGALAASEALRALLLAPREGRLHTLALPEGAFRATPLAGTGCARCGGTA
jgi:hypothetical protein